MTSLLFVYIPVPSFIYLYCFVGYIVHFKAAVGVFFCVLAVSYPHYLCS